MTELKLKLPALVFADDYHEFDHIAYNMNYIVTGGKIRFHEIGCSWGDYIGVAYTGRRPSKATIKEMVKKHKLVDLLEELNA